MPRRKFDGLPTLSLVLMLACLTLNAGCVVKGFQTIPDGPTTPGQLRAGAAVARAEAQSLEAMADEQEGAIRRTLGAVQTAADGIGAPALMGTVVGAAGAYFVPSPGQRRREKLAAAEAKAGAAG